MNRDTIFSPDRIYRYTLWRQWDNRPFCMFIGLNPSTADETQDDPTIRRCIRFAKDWGYGALCMTNIFAFRATDPQVMRAQTDPIGPENDTYLNRIGSEAGIIIAAWGVHGALHGRGKIVHNWFEDRLHHLGLTKDGQPKHPLYLKATSQPIVWK